MSTRAPAGPRPPKASIVTRSTAPGYTSGGSEVAAGERMDAKVVRVRFDGQDDRRPFERWLKKHCFTFRAVEHGAETALIDRHGKPVREADGRPAMDPLPTAYLVALDATMVTRGEWATIINHKYVTDHHLPIDLRAPVFGSGAGDAGPNAVRARRERIAAGSDRATDAAVNASVWSVERAGGWRWVITAAGGTTVCDTTDRRTAYNTQARYPGSVLRRFPLSA